jgi:hypothetical protein
MTRLSTLPRTREQAHHALLLLGVPAPASLLVDVHAALFDGDLSVPALAALLRDEERMFAAGPDGPATALTGDPAGGHGGTAGRPYLEWFVCPGLTTGLAPVRGVLTVSTWTVAQRIRTPAVARAEALAATVRITELLAMRSGPCAAWLLRQLAETVPGGPEALDVLDPSALGDAARLALDDPALAAAVAAEQPVRDAAVLRAAELDERQRLFGAPPVPHQRGGA